MSNLYVFTIIYSNTTVIRKMSVEASQHLILQWSYCFYYANYYAGQPSLFLIYQEMNLKQTTQFR